MTKILATALFGHSAFVIRHFSLVQFQQSTTPLGAQTGSGSVEKLGGAK
jgi:hypothetical protein